MPGVYNHASGVEAVDFDGHPRLLGLQPSNMQVVRASRSYEDTYDIIPRNKWPESHDSMPQFFPFNWDQNGFNACPGYGAVTAATARRNALRPSDTKELSPMFAYSQCNGGRDQGSTPEAVKDVIEQKGTCLMTTFGQDKIYDRQLPAGAKAEAQRFRFVCSPITTIEGAVSAILRNQYFFSGIFVGNNYKPDSQGVLPLPSGQQGGHCMANGGFRKDRSRIYFHKKQSWGRNFGVDGWCWEPEEYTRDGLSVWAAYAVVDALEDPLEPNPSMG